MRPTFGDDWSPNRGGNNIEFILVDDGSTDNTLDRLKGIHETYPNNVRVLAKVNGGVSSARNLGMEVAIGEWVGFLDSDDVFAPEGLQYLLQNCVDSTIDILQFGYKTIASLPQVYDSFTKDISFEGFSMDYYVNMKALTVWRFLYRRTYLQKHNIQFRDLQIGEDGLFNFDVCMADGKIRCVDTVVTYHIDREGSLTTSINRNYVRKVVESVMTAQSVFSDYVATHETTSELQHRIRMHQERQIRFVFSKIRATSDYSLEEIRKTAASFQSYGAFPLMNAKGQDVIINILYQNPILFKFYIFIYSSLRRVKHSS